MTAPALARFKAEGRKIVTVTAYDYPFARLFDQVGVDVLLVGDSLGMVVQGQETPLPVTLDEMIYHARMVARAARRALVVMDLPFGAAQISPEQTMAAAVRAMQESGCGAVKLEGGAVMAETIAFLTARGIPVVAHVGLTPQSVRAFGGFKVQGRGAAASQRVLDDALAVAQAGASAIVLEGIPAALGARITAEAGCPTIGIGAGAQCDGQVLVMHDLLGLYDGVRPKFVKQYLNGGQLVSNAITQFADEVRSGAFPSAEHAFKGE
ncbi:putative 3-methyl-2-oxobutanoate hydroxymethyltransferase [Magnetofaba australis IT-1]|uniref:3-methyl-2-oxobutanoate hydroxymethyltransferase n=1 Tax=Magnetofaba australis IT-1 TaxID=1434232 RepID=A0A1Y2K686_9PROT|nr:putative 3-methyl-2-oxobutanoate hydroxymethyltransferase [Magnetofaba australis IT-1]